MENKSHEAAISFRTIRFMVITSTFRLSAQNDTRKDFACGRRRPLAFRRAACPENMLKCADEKKRTTDESVMRVYWRRGPESNRARRICNPLHNRFATAPSEGFGPEPGVHRARSAPIRRPCGSLRIEKDSIFEVLPFEFGAGKRSRTVDLNLGKVALYQLSYSRERGKL